MSEPVEPALPAAVGKRLGTDEPLTEHDVAERLSKATLRLLRLLTEFRELGMVEVVRGSRYHHEELLEALADELAEGWGVEARALPSGPAEPEAGAYADGEALGCQDCAAGEPHVCPYLLADGMPEPKRGRVLEHLQDVLGEPELRPDAG